MAANQTDHIGHGRLIIFSPKGTHAQLLMSKIFILIPEKVLMVASLLILRSKALIQFCCIIGHLKG